MRPLSGLLSVNSAWSRGRQCKPAVGHFIPWNEWNVLFVPDVDL